MKNIVQLFATAYRWLIQIASSLQSPFLLAVRLYWGWQFFQTGIGKLMHPEKPTEYFQSLGIPFPHQQAILVGCTESCGGLLLLVGLASRLISIPLAITLIVAYLTADLDVVKNIWADSDKFVTATEFEFLFAVLLVLIFGPGKFSLDYFIGKKFAAASQE